MALRYYLCYENEINTQAMSNLSRRIFLRNAGIISIASLTTNPTFAQNQTVSSEGSGLLARISKKTYSLDKLPFKNLLNIYELALNNWKQSGYEAFETNYFVCQNENLALFPLHLHHATVGLIDTAFLCFGKNQMDEWIKLRPLSGLDMEVLDVAAEGLQKHHPDIDLSKFLLPSISQNRNVGFYFDTQKGNVFIKSILSTDSVKTEIIVKEGDKPLFQQTIISQCSLSA